MKLLKKNVIVILGASLFLSACAPSDLQNIVSSGNACCTSNVSYKPIQPKKVRLYYDANHKPKKYKVIGRVSAETYNIVGLEHTQSTIAEELQAQASSIGANGVINISQGLAQTTGDAIIS